jgi:hypothetical protein
LAIRIVSHATGQNLLAHDEALVHMILYLKGTATSGLPYGSQCSQMPVWQIVLVRNLQMVYCSSTKTVLSFMMLVSSLV